jgi:hypothetical protein
MESTPEKEPQIYMHNPPTDFGAIRLFIQRLRIESESEKSAFRMGWMSALTTLSSQEFHCIEQPNNKGDR